MRMDSELLGFHCCDGCGRRQQAREKGSGRRASYIFCSPSKLQKMRRAASCDSPLFPGLESTNQYLLCEAARMHIVSPMSIQTSLSYRPTIYSVDQLDWLSPLTNCPSAVAGDRLSCLVNRNRPQPPSFPVLPASCRSRIRSKKREQHGYNPGFQVSSKHGPRGDRTGGWILKKKAA